jgi:hypothetical protein
MQIVQQRGIKTLEEYRQYYPEDPRLPSAPDVHYGVSWTYFLGKETTPKYTLEEAMQIVQQRGINTVEEYRQYYPEDPRLPSTPDRHYGVSWTYFLTGQERMSKYSLEEAMQIVQQRGIKTWREYRQYYPEDPRLPSDPYQHYGVSLTYFLGKKPKRSATNHTKTVKRPKPASRTAVASVRYGSQP